MLVRRMFAQYIDPRLTDGHIERAIGDPQRVVETYQATPGGTLYRVYGYTYPIASGAHATHEELYGRIEVALLVVAYLDERDLGQVAYVTYAMEADEEEFALYG